MKCTKDLVKHIAEVFDVLVAEQYVQAGCD